ncbi:hypothetical protein F4703DRAFT_1970118 [Phycomyces blakesleeanus]
MTSGGVTIAHHQLASNNDLGQNEEFSMSFNKDQNDDQNVINDQDSLANLLSNPLWPVDGPVEDLTGEVQELMMNESVASWLQQPWQTDSMACLDGFDSQLYAQSIQLQDLFGQDNFNFNDPTNAGFYDELTFAPTDISFDLISPPISGSSLPQSPLEIDSLESSDYSLDVLEQTGLSPELLPTMVEPLETILEPTMVEPVKRRRDSSSSSGSSSGSSGSGSDSSGDDDSSDEENNVVIPTTVANLNSRRRASYSSDESESESDQPVGHTPASTIPVAYAYMHKRQMEESVLDKITHQLHPDKLPGILTIISSENVGCQNNEVEIDLSCLARDQLVRLLSYVDACIVEQNGGPVVNVEAFIVKEKPVSKSLQKSALGSTTNSTSPRKGPRTRPAVCKSSDEDEDDDDDDDDLDGKTKSAKNMTRPAQRQRKPRKPRQKQRVNTGGPMSMASLASPRAQDEDAMMMSLAVAAVVDEDSIAVTRPKRRAALHKRRMLEEMLAPSDNDDSLSEDESEPVIYRDEQMDLGVTANQTIAHQSNPSPPASSPEVVVPAVKYHHQHQQHHHNREEEEDLDDEMDEEIDIMI